MADHSELKDIFMSVSRENIINLIVINDRRNANSTLTSIRENY